MGFIFEFRFLFNHYLRQLGNDCNVLKVKRRNLIIAASLNDKAHTMSMNNVIFEQENAKKKDKSKANKIEFKMVSVTLFWCLHCQFRTQVISFCSAFINSSYQITTTTSRTICIRGHPLLYPPE